MGMVINPFATAPVVVITLGNTLVATTGASLAGDFQQGIGVQASQSFTATKFALRGSGTASSINYRCCVYAATSATVWSGALLGQTAAQSSLGVNELREIPLLASISIVSGNWYALCIQPSAGGIVQGSTTGNSQAFFDAYSDGPAATAGASFANAVSLQCLYISS